MIVFPSAFVLSAAAAGFPLYLPRIAYQTYTFDLADPAVTVSSEIAGAPKDAPLRPDTAEYWQASSLPATWKVDLGAPRDVDYVGIAGHTIGTEGCTVDIDTSLDNVAWTAFAASVLPGDDTPLLFLDAVRSARYVRVTLSGGSAVPLVAVVYVGVALVSERDVVGPGFTPINLSRQTVMNRSLSRGGQFLGQNFRRNGVTGSAKFQYLDPDTYRAQWDPFVKHARRYPFFFGWWPSDYPEEVGYVWCDKDIRPSYMGFIDAGGAALMAVSLEMQGLGNG